MQFIKHLEDTGSIQVAYPVCLQVNCWTFCCWHVPTILFRL